MRETFRYNSENFCDGVKFYCWVKSIFSYSLLICWLLSRMPAFHVSWFVAIDENERWEQKFIWKVKSIAPYTIWSAIHLIKRKQIPFFLWCYAEKFRMNAWKSNHLKQYIYYISSLFSFHDKNKSSRSKYQLTNFAFYLLFAHKC